MKKIFCSELIFVIILFSCKNNHDENKVPCQGRGDTSYVLSSDLQNCKYKTGTYWIFVDSVINICDSVVVIDFNQTYLGDKCSGIFETYIFKTQSSHTFKTTDYVVVAGGLFKNFTGSVNSGTQIYDNYYNASSMTNYLIERLDSIFVYDQYYKKVLRVEIEKDLTENKNKSIYYINSEFGFLRHDIYLDNILISKKILIKKAIIR
jgi:hypothetical protein